MRLLKSLLIGIATLYLIPEECALGAWECDDGEETRKNCTCYKNLIDQLLSSDRNQYNLQQAFFPPNRATPVFVAVTYYFSLHGSVDGSTNYFDTSVSESWHWTTSTFYLLQPMESLQFTSLLFTDSHLRKEKVSLYLERACYQVGNIRRDEMMQLLTQRVRIETRFILSIHTQILISASMSEPLSKVKILSVMNQRR